MIQGGLGKGEVVAISLRMPKHVRDALKIEAIRAGRSYSAHAVMILAEALPSHEQDRQGGNPDGLKQS